MRVVRTPFAVALAATCAVALPAAAAAAKPKVAAKPVTVRGVVVARQQARGTLVVATAKGAVATLRTNAARRVGAKVAVRATRLADGTYGARSITGHGTARRAKVHGVVVSSAKGRLVLSAGGSVFSVSRRRVLSAVGASGGPQPGSVVNASLTINSSSGTVAESKVQQVGRASLVSLDGTISSLASGSLVLTADAGSLTTVAIPSSIVLPSTIAAGDRVELLAQFASGAFTLVSIQDDHAAASSGSGTTGTTGTTGTAGTTGTTGSGNSGGEQANVEAEGVVTAVSSTSLSVQGEHASPVNFAVPAGFDVSGVQVGARVDAKGTLAADGTITLARLEVQNAHEGNGANADVKVEGTVSALDAGSLTITSAEGGSPVRFTIPSGFDVSGIAVGDTVDAKGVANADGSVTLAQLDAKGAGDQGSSGDQG
ncbi:MAG TPA: DUF5666 domain-containing protein, partial [Gaiellaceae bacterium]|nr:DUF5666 domain-containing protein [Gaiellaceae bacterium]